MYRAVIICLIATGCLATVPPLLNRSIRQEPNQRVPSTSAHNISQSPYSIPTYPVYTTIKSPVQEVTTVATPVKKTDVVESPSMMSRMLPYVSPVLQVLVSVILSMSVITLVCKYTSICTMKYLQTEARIHLLISFFQAILKTLSKFA